MKFPALLCIAFLAAPAQADTFRVLLGGKALGQLSYAQQGNKSTLRSTLDNTPLGVFNGTFTGTSAGGTFTGDSKSSRKQRRVVVKISKGRAISTDVAPADELTKLSDPALVPAGVLDPVRAIGQLMTAKGCPAAMRLYDGRRVVALSPTGQQRTDNALVCSMSYKVIAGPGHLSPLRISNAKMQLGYGVQGTVQKLHQIKISSGIFKLSLDRQD